MTIISPDDFYLQNIIFADKEKVKTYWETLEEYDTLRFRLNGILDPSWDPDVLDLITRHGRYMYIAQESQRIVGEFLLESFTGKSAQIHFSMHPTSQYRNILRRINRALNLIFSWRDINKDPFLLSLYTNIAVSNRASCITALKCGFRKIGVLPGGAFIARHNRFEDSSILVREP